MFLARTCSCDHHAGVHPVGEGLVTVLGIVGLNLLDPTDAAVDRSVEVIAAAGDTHVIAVLAQVFGEDPETAGERDVETGHVDRHGRTPREDRRPRRDALRRSSIGARETHPLAREAVEARREDIRIVVASHGKGTLIVAQDEQDIGFLSRRSRAAEQFAAEQRAYFQTFFHIRGLTHSVVSKGKGG